MIKIKRTTLSNHGGIITVFVANFTGRGRV